MLHVRFAIIAIATTVGLFAGMLLFIEFGRRFGLRQIARRGSAARTGVGVVDSAVYSLFALLLGFTFSGAAGRFEHRRDIVADEANAAGTAWQRVDVLPVELQGAIRGEMRHYLDALVAWYGEAPGSVHTIDEPPAVTKAQDNLWSRAVEACTTPNGERARMLLLPALNEMFGLVEKERRARQMHLPPLIWTMLGVSAFAAALFAGYGLASGPTRNWIYIIGLSASVSVATYVIIELEYPRLGLSRVNAIDQALVELRQTMGE
jgi:hypothetical protein